MIWYANIVTLSGIDCVTHDTKATICDSDRLQSYRLTNRTECC